MLLRVTKENQGNMITTKKFGIATAIAGAALAFGSLAMAGTAAASDTSHVLTMNGVSYNSYQESGTAWHFNTPAGITPTSASVAERSQTWTGNGSENLTNPDCFNYGIHWISNSNVLTISHCLGNPNVTTTTVVDESTTTTTVVDESTTTTVVDESTTTTAAQVTTTTEVGSEGPTTTLAGTTTTITGSEGPTTTLTESEAPTTTVAGTLPRTGSSQSILLILGLAMVGGGLLFVALTRKPSQA